MKLFKLATEVTLRSLLLGIVGAGLFAACVVLTGCDQISTITPDAHKTVYADGAVYTACAGECQSGQT